MAQHLLSPAAEPDTDGEAMVKRKQTLILDDAMGVRPLWAALLSLPPITGFIGLSYEAYGRGGYRLALVAVLVGIMASLLQSRLLARGRLRAAFGQYVGPEVVARVLREGTELRGAVRTVTVLTSDLRGFTTLAERLPPEQVSQMMNEYLTAMVEVISAHGGMVQDFVGDGILAVYGAPVDDPNHAWHAVATAIEMQVALQRLRWRWVAQAHGPLAMGVAVHTGEVFAGTVGSPRRKKYAVLGDTVNTVARIEGLNREFSTAILISGSTWAAVKERIVVRDRGSVLVKGRAQPVDLFELLGARDGLGHPAKAPSSAEGEGARVGAVLPGSLSG